MKLYFSASCLICLKEWMVLKSRGLLEWEGHGLRFKLDFKNLYVGYAILKIQNRYKCRQIVLKNTFWFSTQETFIGNKQMANHLLWDTSICQGEFKIKSKEKNWQQRDIVANTFLIYSYNKNRQKNLWFWTLYDWVGNRFVYKW